MINNVKQFQQLNLQNLGFAKPKNTKKGYTVAISYSGKRGGILIKTPKLQCPFGVDKQNGKYSLKLKANNDDIENKEFIDFLNEIDEVFGSLPFEQGWFSEDVEPFYYTANLPDQQCVRVKLPTNYRETRFEFEVESPENELASVGDIKKGCFVSCLLELKSIWICGTTFGYYWNVKKIWLL